MKLFDVYSLYDIEPVRGKGNYVYTADGTPYLDFYGGHAVISIGHSHPRYVDAVSRQVSQLAFYSNSVKNTLQQRLADLLGEISGYDDYQLFLANSGAEANENAIKLASFATGRRRILAFDKAFHGRTSAAVAATDNPRIQAPVNKTDNIVFSPSTTSRRQPACSNHRNSQPSLSKAFRELQESAWSMMISCAA